MEEIRAFGYLVEKVYKLMDVSSELRLSFLMISV